MSMLSERPFLKVGNRWLNLSLVTRILLEQSGMNLEANVWFEATSMKLNHAETAILLAHLATVGVDPGPVKR